MMNKSECFELGKIVKPFGYKGDVIFFLDVDDPSRYAHLDMVFVEINKQLIPYFIKIKNIKGQHVTVSIQDVTTEQAHALIGHFLYLPLTKLPVLTGNHFYFHEIIGFTVHDEVCGNIGVIEGIIDQGPQPIFQINHNNTEILIPIVDHFIKFLDRVNKCIYINAPEGLIEFYLTLHTK